MSARATTIRDFVHLLDRNFHGLPYDGSDPYVFHVPTTIGGGQEALDRVVAWTRAGGALAPLDARPVRDVNGLGSLDIAAGDDRFLFATTGMPYGGSPRGPDRVTSEWPPMLAWRLSYVLSLPCRVGWRPLDLAYAFTREQELRQARLGPREVAEALTVWDPGAIRRLARLYCLLLRTFPPARRARIRQVASRITLEALRAAPSWPVTEAAMTAVDLWKDLGYSFSPTMDQFDVGAAHELVIQGPLPLAAAAYHYDATARRPGAATMTPRGRWIEGPAGGWR
jgi:hypothetical protein